MKKHLLSFGKQVLAQTGEKDIGGVKGKNARKKTSNLWFETQDKITYWRELRQEKIVWGELSDEAKFVLSNSSILNTCFFMVGEKLHYILGLLNSKLVSWYFSFISTKSGMGTTRWLKYTIEQLPLLYPDEIEEQTVADLVDRILAVKKKDSDADTSALESQIDQLVYKLYGLTEEEIAIVEGRGGEKGRGEGEEGGAAGIRAQTSRRRGGRVNAAASNDVGDEELE